MIYILFDINKNILVIINKKEILDKLYFLECRMITDEDIKKYNNNDNSENNSENNGINNDVNNDINNENNIKKIINEDRYLEKIKISISKIEDKIPLYDIYSSNLFLISKHNVYERVVNNYYRFPEKELIDDLKEKRTEMLKKEIKNVLKKRELNKIELIIKFMDYFNINTLYETYIKVFYKYSVFVGKEFTTCKRLSFLPELTHLKPYYSRSEIINIALNTGIEIDSEIEYQKLREMCKIITSNEMPFTTLLEHKKYMINKKCLGAMQYYTLQGSYAMNQYLRNMTLYKNKNDYLENLIEPIWNLIINSPEFDKNYTLYRFIKTDDYISNLKIGNIYTEDGFMSATRNPFYDSENYQFGFILLKINIPKNTKGIALCVETISHFPEEQEIIFPPLSKFKLIKKDHDCIYYHTDINFSSKVKTKYEFDWVSNEKPIFKRKKTASQQYNVNFLSLERKFELSLIDKIKQFENYYVNEMNQFCVTIGEKEITIVSEWYDSVGAYKKFYATETKNGYSLYSLYDNYILFFIELTEENFEKHMHVNYYVKYSAIDSNKILGDENLIKFYSSIAYYFDIHNVFIYANYMNCDNINIDLEENQGSLFSGSYCVDFFQYFTQNKKKYSELNILNNELYPAFSYYDFNFLKTIELNKLILKTDGELYQIYEKIYLPAKNKNNIIDFYIWLINTKCYLLDTFINLIDRITENNPFKTDFYHLDPISYLYNRKYIKTYSSRFKIIKNTKRNIINKSSNIRI